MEYNIIEKLGKGFFGTTYKVEYKNKNYALKKQKILKEHLKKNLKFNIWRELEFYKWIDKLDKNDKIFFMRLHDIQFEDSCELVQDRIIQTDYSKKLDKSKYCINLLLDLKDGTIDKINFNENEKKSLLIQILYIFYLLRKSKWIHGDIHPANIAYTKVDKSTQIIIKINNKKYKFNSYGYIFSLIDYGLCTNKKFIKNQKELKDFNKLFQLNFDLWCFIEDYAMNNYENGKLLRENDINTKKFHKNLLYYIYKNKKLLYEKIKFIMKDYANLFEKFEKNIYDKNIIYDFSQYVQIYENELYYELLNLKMNPNKYSNEILEYIKLNNLDLEKLILTLIKNI